MTRKGHDLDATVARARREAAERERGYREQALKMYPWVCGRCGRAFDRLRAMLDGKEKD